MSIKSLNNLSSNLIFNIINLSFKNKKEGVVLLSVCKAWRECVQGAYAEGSSSLKARMYIPLSKEIETIQNPFQRYFKQEDFYCTKLSLLIFEMNAFLTPTQREKIFVGFDLQNPMVFVREFYQHPQNFDLISLFKILIEKKRPDLVARLIPFIPAIDASEIAFQLDKLFDVSVESRKNAKLKFQTAQSVIQIKEETIAKLKDFEKELKIAQKPESIKKGEEKQKSYKQKAMSYKSVANEYLVQATALEKEMEDLKVQKELHAYSENQEKQKKLEAEVKELRTEAEEYFQQAKFFEILVEKNPIKESSKQIKTAKALIEKCEKHEKFSSSIEDASPNDYDYELAYEAKILFQIFNKYHFNLKTFYQKNWHSPLIISSLLDGDISHMNVRDYVKSGFSIQGALSWFYLNTFCTQSEKLGRQQTTLNQDIQKLETKLLKLNDTYVELLAKLHTLGILEHNYNEQLTLQESLKKQKHKRVSNPITVYQLKTKLENFESIEKEYFEAIEKSGVFVFKIKEKISSTQNEIESTNTQISEKKSELADLESERKQKDNFYIQNRRFTKQEDLKNHLVIRTMNELIADQWMDNWIKLFEMEVKAFKYSEGEIQSMISLCKENGVELLGDRIQDKFLKEATAAEHQAN